MQAAASSPSPGSLEIVHTAIDGDHLNYVVNAYIYDEEPGRMVVTCRGEGGGRAGLWKLPGFRASNHGGISVFDVESEPARPRLVGRWDAPSRVEGQDRRGDVLVVTDITDGVLYVFDAARSVAEGPVGSCNLSVNGALHVRLYCPGGDGSGGESEATGGGGAGRLPMFALVTSGFATYCGVPGLRKTLLAVDVTDPSHPTEVASTHEQMPFCPEGIFVHQDRAYVGGVNDTKLSVYGLAGLPLSIQHVATYEDCAFHQCVGQNTTAANAADPTLYAALWAQPGGIGIFDVSGGGGGGAGELLPVLGRLVTSELSMSNRVVLTHGRTRALLPLETFPGGVGVVDVSDPHQPQLLAALKFTEDHDTVYCACAAGDIIYAFAAKACQMVVLQSRLP